MDPNYKIDDPRLTRGEYWLIESCVYSWSSLHSIFSEDYIRIYNKRNHCQTNVKLIETLSRLVNGGILFLRCANKIATHTEPKIIEEIIKKQPHNKESTYYYGLTVEGGTLWENFAMPNWDFFIDDVGRFLENNMYQCSISGKCEKNVKAAYNYLEKHDYIIDKESVYWELLTPYQANYWKEFKKGYRVTFQCTERKKTYIQPHPQDSYDRLWYAWH